MKRVFVDSGAFFAHLVVEDAFHETARSIFGRAVAERWRLVTSNAVVYETHALLLNRVRNGRAVAMQFLEGIRGGLSVVERIRRADEDRATVLLQEQNDKTYTLCDALSFVLMERLHISEAVSFDRHFREYGRIRLVDVLA